MEAGFEPLRDAFETVLESQVGTGAALAAWHDERWVADLWGGASDAAQTRGWQADSIVMPGHIFPIQARPGGVLVRAGLVEGAMDLVLKEGDYAGLLKWQEEERAKGRIIGIGLSTYVEVTGGGPTAPGPACKSPTAGRCGSWRSIRCFSSARPTPTAAFRPTAISASS